MQTSYLVHLTSRDPAARQRAEAQAWRNYHNRPDALPDNDLPPGQRRHDWVIRSRWLSFLIGWGVAGPR